MQDKLFSNSIFMMLTTASTTFFGFFFWFLAARAYTTEEVGIATAIISSMALIVMLSKLGLDFSIIRFFPTYDRSSIFSSSVIVSVSISVLGGIVFISGIGLFSPELSLLKYPPYAILFLLTLAAASVTALCCTTFLAIRKASLQFVQSIVVGSRVVFMLLLSIFGAIGIFSAVGASFLLAMLTAYILLSKENVILSIKVDWKYLKSSFHFSAGNYLSGLFMTGPTLVLPVMVLNLLGAEEAAYYYISYAVAALLLKIPHSVSMSLFVEGSHGADMRKSVERALLYAFALLTPISLILYVFSEGALGLMGDSYSSGGFEVLRLMIIASLFTGVNSVYLALKRIQKDIKRLILISGVIGGTVLASGYIFMGMFGLLGAGYAWIAGNLAGCFMIFFSLVKEKYRLKLY